MRQRTKFGVAGAVIMLAATYLIFSGMGDTTAYFQTVSEATEQLTGLGTAPVRVKGRVRPGSIVWSPREVQLRFVLGDDHREVPVIYHGLLPDLFAEGREVIVEGHLTPTELTAETILTSCPSKYGPEDPATAHRHL